MAVVKKKKYYTTNDIAGETGMTPETVRLWARDGKIPSPELTTPGKHRRWSHDQFVGIINGMKTKAHDAVPL